MSGAVSGAFTSLALTPIELVKCQMQVPSTSTAAAAAAARAGPLSLVASIYRRDGLAGFWRGQLGTLIRETGGSAAWFGTYEAVVRLFHAVAAPDADGGRGSLAVYQQMLAGAAAGMNYNLLFFPADTIKSRMQTEQVLAPHLGRRASFVTVGRALWRQQGLRGLYQGCGITVARSGPSSAFIFVVYEALRKYSGST